MYHIYLLQAEHQPKKLYLGATSNLADKLQEHNSGRIDRTRGLRWKLVYQEAYLEKHHARKRELLLKKNPQERERLISSVCAGSQS